VLEDRRGSYRRAIGSGRITTPTDKFIDGTRIRFLGICVFPSAARVPTGPATSLPNRSSSKPVSSPQFVLVQQEVLNPSPALFPPSASPNVHPPHGPALRFDQVRARMRNPGLRGCPFAAGNMVFIVVRACRFARCLSANLTGVTHGHGHLCCERDSPQAGSGPGTLNPCRAAEIDVEIDRREIACSPGHCSVDLSGCPPLPSSASSSRARVVRAVHKCALASGGG
jgi:hypothetical protein